MASFRSEKPLPIFLSDIKINIWTFLFYKKKFLGKENLLRISKSRYFLLGGRAGIIFDLFLEN